MTIPEIENELTALKLASNDTAKELRDVKKDLAELRGQIDVGRPAKTMQGPLLGGDQ